MIYSILCIGVAVVAACCILIISLYFCIRAIYLYVKSLFIEEYDHGY
jgi:hypothetical protein